MNVFSKLSSGQRQLTSHCSRFDRASQKHQNQSGAPLATCQLRSTCQSMRLAWTAFECSPYGGGLETRASLTSQTARRQYPKCINLLTSPGVLHRPKVQGTDGPDLQNAPFGRSRGLETGSRPSPPDSFGFGNPSSDSMRHLGVKAQAWVPLLGGLPVTAAHDDMPFASQAQCTAREVFSISGRIPVTSTVLRAERPQGFCLWMSTPVKRFVCDCPALSLPSGRSAWPNVLILPTR